MEQAQSTGCLSGITVESVRNDFADWRNNKTTHKIPDYLWNKVFQLLKNTRMSVVAKQLKLSYSQIKAKRNALKPEHKTKDSIRKTSDFVTITVDPREIQDRQRPIVHPVKIILKNGSIIHSELPTDIFLQLIHGKGYATD